MNHLEKFLANDTKGFEARKIFIEILGIDWYIEDRELLEKGISLDEDYKFANIEECEGLITFIHNCIVIGMEDKWKTDKRFLEVCEFIYLVDDKEKKRFTGNFIDALEFIKQEGDFYV